jgi:hypothetical protein
MEMIEASRNYYGYEDPFDIVALKGLKIKLENEMDMQPYEMVLQPLIQRSKVALTENTERGMEYTKNMDDEQINTLARSALKAFDLPEDRLVNIENEMKAYRMFYNRCLDKNMDIFQQQHTPANSQEGYKYPVYFILKSKQTGVETPASSDMDQLLKVWGL